MDNKKDNKFGIIDIINFHILSHKYSGLIDEQLKVKVVNQNNDKIFEDCKKAFTDWIELMCDAQKNIFDLFEHSQTVGYTEDFFKYMKEYKDLWNTGLKMMNDFSNTIDVIMTTPGEQYEETLNNSTYLS